MLRPIRLLAVLLAILVGLLGVSLDAGSSVAATRPVVTKIGPGSGPLTPTRVVITGQHLRGVKEVRFGTRKATIVRRISASAIEVRTPRATRAGVVSVRVKTAAGWSKTSTRARYAFVAKPVLTRLSPTRGAFTGGLRLTLTGKNLTRTTAVRFGTVKAAILSRSAGKIIVRTPVGVLGRTSVTVTTPGGKSRGAAFTYVTPAARSTKTVTPAAQTATAPAGVEWVTGGDDPATTDVEPWVVGLPTGSTVPEVGRPFLVRPGTAVFPSGVAGTVIDVAVQADDSVRVTVAAAPLEQVLDRIVIDFSGEPTTAAGVQRLRRGVEPAATSPTRFDVDGNTALECKNELNQPAKVSGSLTITLTDIDIDYDLDLGNLVRRPSFAATVTTEFETAGKITVARKASCSLKPEWQNTHRRVLFLGATGATVSIAPELTMEFSAKGTWSITDRTRLTSEVKAQLGKRTTHTETARSFDSKQGGALSLEVEVAAGASLQFGLLDRVGVEAEFLLGVSVELRLDRENICVSGTVFLKATVGFYVDLWVERWEADAVSFVVNLFNPSGCLLPDGEAPADEPEITSARLPDAQVAQAYEARLTTADDRPGTWSVLRGPLPDGLSLDPGTGTISGTPTGQVNDYTVVVDFTDADEKVATTTIRIRVQPSQGIGGGDIQVTLRWTGPADLDLHVVDPSTEHIWYGNREAASGGQLDRDANAGCNGPTDDDSAVENVFWPPRNAPPGTYSTWVQVYRVCDGDLSWRLTVRRNGAVIIEETGTGDSPAYSFGVGTPAPVEVGARPRVAELDTMPK